MHKTSTAGVLLAALCLATHAMGASLANAPPRQWVRAVTGLEAAIQRTEETGSDLPRLVDPKARPLILAAFDERVFSGMERSDPTAFMDQNNFANMCDKPIWFAGSYAGHGLRNVTLAQLHAPEPNPALRQIRRNNAFYQDERALAISFATTCFGLQISAAKASFDATPRQMRTPGFIQGIRLMTSNAPKAYLAALRNQSEPQISLSNRSRMLDRAVQFADAYATILTPGERQDAADMTEAAQLYAPPSDRAKLLHIRQVLSKPCTGPLCALDVQTGQPIRRP